MLLQKLKIKAISLLTFNLLLAVWLGLFLNISFYERLRSLTPYTGIKANLFVAASVMVVIAVYNFILQWVSWKWNAKLIAMILIVIGGLASYMVTSLGVLITADQIQNIMQTNFAEARDTWSWSLLLWVIGMIIFPLTAMLLIPIKFEPIAGQILSKFVVSGLSLLIVAGTLFIFYVDFAAIFREHRDLKRMLSPQNMLAASASYYKKKVPHQNLPLLGYGVDAKIHDQNTENLPKLMVLVVGETARAESFALDGYARNTNPKLAQQEIINFSQVSSCGTATAVSLPCMFSGMPRVDYDEQLASHREGLLDIAKRAGYQVTWIDNNSGCKGTCDRVEQFKIPDTLQQKWCKNDECLDGILVDSLKVYLEKIPAQDTRPRLVVLHQIGSHGPAYYERVPRVFSQFKPTCDTNAIQGCDHDQLINSYDNTVLYTDHILDTLIETLKNTTQYRSAMWYLSDHGESTGEHGMYLHGAPYAIAPTQQTHIPMLMWFSKSWQQQAEKQIGCLLQQQNKKLSQDNLFPTMLSLLDVKTKVIDSSNNMLTACTHP
ncbi:phosphoethanolamine--lipid A transferase [Acinetobacter haemolyticus]|uniref:phosphoethanolamine transferase n=1 Tax=Acinetobacter haemolyticus TaxID=29430 RepID=UPI001331D3F3|nr:phosphoethanolamine--lipid A transferase [Acinetobacter haemolyticus]NAR16793.1 phosphoethanolamine--lipid A transferase [Acinetobacter haemolyticus]NAR34949.1 phosphoethanolamine--lipid A transferase [Acinetobacter haemolyticus]NAR46267.1 phosphoethanolamine--lipid A transferase [Acinetobacter haemolyticus]NCU22933.1 phosphoethanolamine--lipid A transferase [Acinetobacter haemolyticus]QHI19110.1 phosphoethanolamine--lipid A transferase [Acinetobacter haemolyticus]